MFVCIGQKFYKYNDSDNPDIFKITKVRKKEVIGILNDKDIIKIKPEELKKYTLIKPDGFITFSVVELGDKNEDVIITLHRNTEPNGISKPYAVCRQGIADVFANQVIKDDSVFMIGTSVNSDNCPTNVNFDMLLACDKNKYYKIIACYMEDTLEDVLNLIDLTKFDETLKRLYNKSPSLIKLMDINLPVHGFCKSLNELLEFNDFEYDYLKAFNIHKVPFSIEIDDTTMTNKEQINYIQNITNCYIFNTYVMPYSKMINLNLIKRNYVLISDTNKHVYVVAYDCGEHLNKSEIDIYKYIKESLYSAKKKMEPIYAYKDR